MNATVDVRLGHDDAKPYLRLETLGFVHPDIAEPEGLDLLRVRAHAAAQPVFADFDLSIADLRRIPNTNALLEQKLRSLDPVESWWLDRLSSGVTKKGDSTWQTKVPTDVSYDDYISHCEKLGIKRKLADNVFGKELLKLVPDIENAKRTMPVPDDNGAESSKRVRCYLIPDVDTCRKFFAGLFGQEMDWPDDDGGAPEHETTAAR